MTKIQKIFFYTGTALVDPDAEHGCPFHPDHKEVDDQGLCTAICKRPLLPVYRCTAHPNQFTSNPQEKCTADCGKERKPGAYICQQYHGNIKKSQPGRCEEICGNPAEELRKGFGCTRHQKQQQFDKKPSDEWRCNIVCDQKLEAIDYVCEEHRKGLGPSPHAGKCGAACGRPMDQQTDHYRCPNHTQKLVDTQGGLCQEICGSGYFPLKNALGYRRNVSVFMDFVGGNLDSGKDWGFCVNVARDPQDKTSPGTTGYRYTTIYAGRRRFRYYAPEKNWTAKETKVDDYLKDYKVLNGKPDVLVETASLLKDFKAAKSLGWPAKYKLYGTKEVDNCSSKCFADELNRLQVWLSEAVKDQKDQKVKVFAVCDCNSFHNSAYFFGLLALSKHVKSTWQIDRLNLQKTSAKNEQVNTVAEYLRPPVLILNFDRHNDDTCKEDLANSDGWGEALLRNFQCGAYLAIGVPPSGSINLRVKIPKKIAPKKPKKDSKKEKEEKEEKEYEYETASGKNLEALIAELKDLNKKQPPVPKEEPLGKLPPEEEAPPPQQEEQPSGEGGEPAPAPPPAPEINLVVSTVASSNVSHLELLKQRAGKVAEKGVMNGKDGDEKFESDKPWKKVWEEVQKLLNRHIEKQITIKYYYITIDRDCMLHNHNQWGDNLIGKIKGDSSFFNDEKHINQAIEAIRKSLGEDAVLTGMDITGLPESQYLPGTDKKLISIPMKNELNLVRKNDKRCVYPKCRNDEILKKECPESKSDLKCQNRHSHHPKCGHKICPYKSCPSAKCPEPECKECRTEIMTKLGDEIDFWYKEFKTWCGA